jgi:2-polyprenyl-6-hydroxyphenyl methylase / 3-demethylubiquinone-9 3-methyltransferase
MTLTSPSIDNTEIEKFSRMADEWWDEGGKFKPLHHINPVRLAYIQEQVRAHTSTPLSELSFLDIGCGGGLLAEPLARLGASVTGIDASEKNIRIASLHAEQCGVTVDYRCQDIESLAASGAQYDVVLSMEVIEHVADVAGFLTACCAVVKPGGLLLLATLNRTLKSYMMAIVGAEYVLKWLPRGTHDWSKFLTPSEIAVHLRHNNIALQKIKGISYRPLKDNWGLSNDIDVNYMMVGRKL